MESKVTVNNSCFTGTPGDTLRAFGDGTKMGLSMSGAAVTCCCVFIFAYISTTSASALPKVLAVCCVLSLISSILQYFGAKSDIESLKSSGKLKSC